MLAFLLGLINPLSRILKTIDNKVDNATERDRIKAETVQAYVNAQAQVLTGRGWWFPAAFILPTALHYGAVNVYSVFWCRACAFPQAWSIAALPAPFDQWEGAIVMSMFVGFAGKSIIARFKA